MDPELASALCFAAAVLSVKMALSHMGNSRSRIILAKTHAPNTLGPMFKVMMLAYASLGTPPTDVFERMEKNNVENEPHVLLLIAFAGLAKSMDTAVLITCLNILVASRCLHNVLMCFSEKGANGVAMQTMVFMPSLLIPFYVGGCILASCTC